MSDPNSVYIVAHEGEELVGAIHGYAMLHPAGVKYFYVDELDTVVKFRRQGVGRALMEAAMDVATELGCIELWLGTEHEGRDAANAL